LLGCNWFKCYKYFSLEEAAYFSQSLPQPLAGGGAYAIRAWHAAAVEKRRTAGVAVRRLVLAPRRVDWPAQPSLDLAQNYFIRISWIVLRVGPLT